MKKIFIFAMSAMVFMTACTETTREPNIVNAEKEFKDLPSGNPKIPASTREYTWRAYGTVLTEYRDSVTIALLNKKDGWTTIRRFKKPENFSKKTGDSVTVIGTQWTGAYEGGWVYKIE